ncbi:MAG: hypothetical protein MUF71_14920 [Candidatus Kapabacteria bacterium]|jgi:hypothetical protein|nr:hypothetical protein [Candidatus Kapabacteria bacterium]
MTLFHRTDLRPALILAAIAFLLLTPLIFYGLDYTDTGYSTVMAWMQAAHPKAALWDFNNFGSAFLAGFWFFTGAESLLAYRFQWVLMIVATALCSYAILSWFYEDKRAIVISLVPALILAVFNSEEGLIVEYHNLPGFLALLSAVPLLRYFAPRLAKPNLLLLMLTSGFVAAFMVFSRLPMLLWCAAVYAVLGFAAWRGFDKRAMVTIAAWLFVGFCAGCLVIVGLLVLRGFTLQSVVADSIKSITAVNTFHDYAMKHPELGYYPLTISTGIRYGKILGTGALALVIAFVWKRLTFLRGRVANVVEGALLLAFGALIVSVVIVLASKSLGFHYGPITSLLLGAPLLIVGYIFLAEWREMDAGKQVLILCAFAFFGLVSLGGSGVWVSNFRHGVWLIFPIALLEMQRFQSRFWEFRFVRLLLIVGAVVLGISLRIQMPYRDQPTYRLNARFAAPVLSGIASSAGRTQTLEELLAELRTRGVKAGDTLQAYPSMATVYFATKTLPWYKHPWIGQMWTVRQDLIQHTKVCDVFPRYVVRAKFDPNTAIALDSDRPTVPFSLGYTPEKLFYGEYAYCHDCTTYLDSLFLVQQRYKVVWENKGFALFAKP